MKYFDSKEAEKKWSTYWQVKNVYGFDKSSNEDVFSVDTPPPTVSGSLHMGHVFSYTHTDIICRFQRMKGKNVFYPMGWDDNGLPTERRVQNYYHIQCDPHLPYDPGLNYEQADRKTQKEKPRKMSRKNFIEHCRKLTKIDEQIFKDLWMRNGLSVQWDNEYSTIDEKSITMAQWSFIDLYEKGHLYNSEAPVTWDIDYETAVAQAEIEDWEEESFYHFIHFPTEEGELIPIATTRPELLPACVGITAHPEDKRYKHLFGKKAITPLFHVPVPIFPSEEADPEKGTGILMVCTFGDAMDVEWWRREQLPLRQIIGPNGRLQKVDFHSENWCSLKPHEAKTNHSLLEGKTIKTARGIILDLLSDSLYKEKESTRHAVRYYEKGKRPLEILSSRQWFLSLMDKKEDLIKAGEQIRWHPAHMGKRYRNWTENLKFDWCISRQKFFGVPIPLWYKIDENGRTDYDAPILPEQSMLPLDPAGDIPPGFTSEDRDQPGGFTAEKDIFDTWFTSSLTPQISSGMKKIPLSIRPQSHEIIRTWTFYTIVKSLLHEKAVPWNDILISGWILDKDRKKMSKSQGNVETPESWFEKYGSDAVRYWAAGARLGTDTAFDEQVLKAGRKLVTKLFNAAKFIYSFSLPEKTELKGFDLSFKTLLQKTVSQATADLEQFHFANALQKTEQFFWTSFCDSYLELVKQRAKESDYSAIFTLRESIDQILKVFAPYFPFITEELWHMKQSEQLSGQSIHREKWPAEGKSEVSEKAFLLASTILGLIHKHKTEEGVSLKESIDVFTLTLNDEENQLFPIIEGDLKRTGWIKSFEIQ